MGKKLTRKEVMWRAGATLIVLYLFLLSIKIMGTSFKIFGSGFNEQLILWTTNPFVGLFIGILATSLVQSSSVTTAIVVGLTATGGLTIGNAVAVIMGANIGTSITNTIVSLAHIRNRKEFRGAFEIATVHDIFNFIIVLFLFPLELLFHPLEKSAHFLSNLFLGAKGATFNSPFNAIVEPVTEFLKDLFGGNPWFLLIFALVLLFGSLHYFMQLMKPLADAEFKHLLHKHIFGHPFKSFLFGILLTIMVQSSSVSSSLVVPIAALSIVSLRKLFPYILGANIGTTFTALLASIVTGSPAAVTVALEHVLFNTFGSVFIWPIREIPIKISEKLSHISTKSRYYVIAYISLVFYIVPLSVIMIARLF